MNGRNSVPTLNELRKICHVLVVAIKLTKYPPKVDLSHISVSIYVLSSFDIFMRSYDILFNYVTLNIEEEILTLRPLLRPLLFKLGLNKILNVYLERSTFT